MTTLDKDRLMPPELTPDDVAMLSAAQRMIMESLDLCRASRLRFFSDEGATPAGSSR